LSLLRSGVYSHKQILEEEGRLSILLEEVKEGINAYSESVKSMLDYVIAFSGLVKNASTYFRYGLDTEKRDLVVQVFSELYIENGELKYVAKYGYDTLLKRFSTSISNYGAPQYVFHELVEIANLVKRSLPELKNFMDDLGGCNRSGKVQ
jgi:hypothetical protein